MNRSKFALFVALLIHLFIMLIFWVLGNIIPPIKKDNTNKEQKIKVSLKELPKKIIPKIKEIKTSSKTTATPVPMKIAPPMPKGSQLKEIVKKPPIKYEPKPKKQVPKLNPKPVKKVEKQKKVLKKPQTEIKKDVFIPIMKERKKLPEQEAKKEKKTDPVPLNWLYEDQTKFEKPKTKIEKSTRTSSGRNIKELYGSTFGELSQAQQEYILDNQEIMRRITQQILTRQASVSNLRGLNVNKTNVIEFYLHPNGDMTDFKFLAKSGYFILDEITRVTIEYAYSKYPRPKEKTLIRYNVFYNLKSF
ncbi:hypothetical protein N9X61_02955 [Sulfurimonas sp.]|nr:hypothetical protein [Sulfurimonas sp.]